MIWGICILHFLKVIFEEFKLIFYCFEHMMLIRLNMSLKVCKQNFKDVVG